MTTEDEKKDNASVSKPQATANMQKDSTSEVTPCSESWHDIECYIQNYSTIAEWIRFADAKAAVVLTVSGAAAGFLIPTLKEVLANDATDHLIPFWKTVVLSLFAFYIFFFLFSNIIAFLCINPYRTKGGHPSLNHCKHFHPAAIAANYGVDTPEEFVANVTAGGSDLLRSEIQSAILLDAHISNYKYGKVRFSLQLFFASVVSAFLYYLAAQL